MARAKKILISVVMNVDNRWWDTFVGHRIDADARMTSREAALARVTRYLNQQRTGTRGQYTLWMRDVATSRAIEFSAVLSIGFDPMYSAVRIGRVRYDDILDTLAGHMRMMETT